MSVTLNMLVAWSVLAEAASPRIIVHIPTSDALVIAQKVARDEGYDISDTRMYFFDSLDSGGQHLAQGYTSMGFYINGSIRSSISINETTGQVLDTVSCELFDYPDLRSFQERILRASKVNRKTPGELADEVGCPSLKVLTTPISPVKSS